MFAHSYWPDWPREPDLNALDIWSDFTISCTQVKSVWRRDYLFEGLPAKNDVVCREQINAGQFIYQVIDKYQEEKGSTHRALWHTILRYVRSNGGRPNCTLNVLFYSAVNLGMDPHCFHLLEQQTIAHRVEGFREIWVYVVNMLSLAFKYFLQNCIDYRVKPGVYILLQ